jgi:hypothetical protein
MCGDNSTLAHTLSKIPRLHFDRVDVQVRNVDVTSPQTAWRRFAWVRAGAAMAHLVAA